MKKRFRTQSGSALTEFAPALYILLLVIFFPMLDLIGMALTYADCLFLSYQLTRQAGLEQTLVYAPAAKNGFTVDLSLVNSTGGPLSNMILAWSNEGLGRFANTVGKPSANATIDLSEGTNTVKFIHVTTICTCRPFLMVPFFMSVTGLNAPYTLTFNNRAVIENVPN